ncbi:MAG: exodeoxyribonuclease VII large subunit [Cyanobacteria bacterium REEB417]|nr:exodeoxyribonuclease VII large subunit [Cyanobacteria bacterium REEB417]
MTSAPIPRYSISELNQAVGNLLERGFAPRFLLDATVIKPQLKKGHLWMTLSDGEATIGAVVWASQRARLSHEPRDGDGVVVVGKLNFWVSRASLSVQVLEVRPSLSTVLRQFEQVSRRLAGEGLLDPARKRPLPQAPGRIAVLTSVPSSALADLLRTAAERWPATAVLVVPIPVQGAVEGAIATALTAVSQRAQGWGIEAVVLARGGGSREDLAVFDSEAVARAVAACAVPVVSGLGHEDDSTVADLVADRRAATPTAAMVALLPDRLNGRDTLARLRRHLGEQLRWRLSAEQRAVQQLKRLLTELHPSRLIERRRTDLQQRRRLLEALSPQHWLARGFVLLHNSDGELVSSVNQTRTGDVVRVQLTDGVLDALITTVTPGP